MIYRRKPTEHEAWQFMRQNREDWPLWMQELPNPIGGAMIPGDEHNGPHHLRIHTKEGDLIVMPGTWIVKGTVGEIYPVQPDIFPLLYDPL